MRWKNRQGWIWAAWLLAVPRLCWGFQFSNAYYSPRNCERDTRRVTRYVILHTTEAPASSALQKLRDNGEANFCVDVDGRVYRIVDHRREAFHCGRSMWNGHSNMDDCSVGIEVVGYHDHDITAAQYQSLTALLTELKFVYHIPDERVLTHSMVAYGSPNKWFTRSHRGRKRCGMLFARASVRRRLHLAAQPRFDPDVRAGRLIIGDPYLAHMLYGSAGEQDRMIAQGTAAPPTNVVSAKLSVWDIARDAYNNAGTTYVFPNGTRYAGNQLRNWREVPYGTRIIVGDPHQNPTEGVQTIGVDGTSAKDIAGDEAWSGTTLYIFRDSHFQRGCDVPSKVRDKLPSGTRLLVGFVAGGPISATRRAYDICGARWRQPYTFYLLPDGTIKSGADMSDAKIPLGSYVFYRN